MIHLLDVARYLFGEVDELTCRTASVRPGIKGEDAATLMLAHADGATSVVDATYQARQDPDPFPQTLIEIDGAHGTIRLRQGYELTVVGPAGTERRSVAPPLLPWASEPWHGVQESVLNTQRQLDPVPARRPRARDLGQHLDLKPSAAISSIRCARAMAVSCM